MSKTYYPKYKTLLKTKLELLSEHHGKCQICGEHAECIHHIDQSKENHSKNNLIVLCYKCHNSIHESDRYKGTKYRKLYGKSLTELVQLSGISTETVWRILNKPNTVKKTTLNRFIEKTKIEKEDLIKNTVPKD